MTYLVDTSILARLANTADADYESTARAVLALHRRGESLSVAPQNLIEFRSVATRPTTVNGLGLSAADTESVVNAFETAFPLLPETPDIYPTWKRVVQTAGVLGKQVYDARLVAICHVYGVTHVLTFNVQHFARFASIAPGLIVVDPATL
ncbi:MAG: PIN domain-containing protein [Anaerolineae bacterium]